MMLVDMIKEKLCWRSRALKPDPRAWIADLWNNGRRRPGFDAALRMINGSIAPCVDVSEDREALEVTMELPGVAQPDVHIELSPEQNYLVIRGEKRPSNGKLGEGFHRAERFFGSFQRSVSLPTTVNAEGATTSFEMGVLTVRLPKSAKSVEGFQPIPVAAAGE